MKLQLIICSIVLTCAPALAAAQDLPDRSDVKPDDVVASAATTEGKPAKKAARAPTAKPPQPSVLHTPESYASGGEDLHVYATLHADWEFERVYLAYRPQGGDEYTEVDFERANDTEFVAIIPGEAMQPPGVEYYVGSQFTEERPSGDRAQSNYASPADPHRVVVLDETERTREAARLARHDGNRSEFELGGEFTNWGRSQALTREGQEVSTDALSDWMWSSELQYRYRFLSSLYEIAFGLGVFRGHQRTYTGEDGAVVANPAPGLTDGEPGMNYGWGQVTWEFHRNFSMDARLLLGASATGFAAGIGGVARIGRLGGTRLELGGELFEDIGSVGFMGFYWDTLPRVPMGLTVELTNRPNPSDPAGTRLMYDIGYDLSEAFGLTARVGVPIRSQAIDQGFTGGISARYAF